MRGTWDVNAGDGNGDGPPDIRVVYRVWRRPDFEGFRVARDPP